MPDPEEEEKDKMGSFTSKFSSKHTSVNRTGLFCNRQRLLLGASGPAMPSSVWSSSSS